MKKKKSAIGSHDILTINNSVLDQLFINVALVEVFAKANIKAFVSASEAMDYLFKEEYLPDLVILDLNVGELSGKAFITLIKHSRNLDNIPLIILSNAGHEQELLRLGADDFYRKPSDLADVIELLRKIKSKWLPRTDLVQARMMAGIVK